jgi:hypothetical protein
MTNPPPFKPVIFAAIVITMGLAPWRAHGQAAAPFKPAEASKAMPQVAAKIPILEATPQLTARLAEARLQMQERARECVAHWRPGSAALGARDETLQTLRYHFTLVRDGAMDTVSQLSSVALLHDPVDQKGPPRRVQPPAIASAELQSCIIERMSKARWRAGAGDGESVTAIDVLHLGDLMGPPRYDMGAEVAVSPRASAKAQPAQRGPSAKPPR